ncbi:MAG TPA: GNAT family N-acetyltransferase [Xanthobacteraceae bacterium]|nr:GNAT family N-acetyltransferase [Xanthobacteraceae bacterium]
MGRANPSFALRPFLPEDVPVLAEIFRASVEGLAAEDYSESQVDVWASAADDEEQFAARLAASLTLVATMDGAAVGFASLDAPGHIDFVYVHPAVAGRGAGTMLVDALTKLAAARGAIKLTVEASDNAQEFFRRRGFKALQRNSVPMGGEWLANTTMEKPLATKTVLQ